MKHFAAPSFWQKYSQLPSKVQKLADANFDLLKANSNHPSLHFKKIHQQLWSARVGMNYRALATKNEAGYIWFWIGSHADYDKLL